MPVTCYICGREFGTKSIKIHIPQCQKKWDNEQAKLPPNQRRSAPSAPNEFDKIISGEIKDPKLIQEINAAAFDDWNKKALVECDNCGRTFLPKSLEVHLRSCKKLNDSLNNSSSNNTSPSKNVVNRRTPVIRPGTYTKSEGKKGGGNRGRSDRSPVSKQDLIRTIEKDVVFNSPVKRQELMDYIQKLCLNS